MITIQKALDLLDEADRWGKVQGKSWIQYLGVEECRRVVAALNGGALTPAQLEELREITDAEPDASQADIVSSLEADLDSYEEWLARERAERQRYQAERRVW